MNPEEKKAYNKAYYEANKIEITRKKKARFEDNKLELSEQRKIRDKSNKIRIDKMRKAWSKKPQGHKSLIIANWKTRGLIHDDYNALYESYLQATNCNACKSEFKDSTDRCMDHDHTTGLFRQFLCRCCNVCDRWRKFSNASSYSGTD